MATNDNNIENKIIETAQQLFVKNGFTDTNMSDIAAAVGIALHCIIISGQKIKCSKPFLETSYFLWLPKFKGLWCRTNPYPNG